jgi:integrase-like protein
VASGGRLPLPTRWDGLAILVYAEAAGLARRPEEAVVPGRWRDQPVNGKYIGEQFGQAAELAGIPLERPLHTLRLSYARALRRVEAPLEAVQAAIDHSNLATTSICVRQLEGQEDPWWPKLAAELGLDGGGEASPLAEDSGEHVWRRQTLGWPRSCAGGGRRWVGPWSRWPSSPRSRWACSPATPPSLLGRPLADAQCLPNPLPGAKRGPPLVPGARPQEHVLKANRSLAVR